MLLLLTTNQNNYMDYYNYEEKTKIVKKKTS